MSQEEPPKVGMAMAMAVAISADHGVTWATNFDFIYRPRKSGG